ncbi:PREDICTED: la-related protein 6 [Lepidothrix coronata]|uniref:La-related protein 6 n=1 Tax=Lepidothrix coronata TaxID=321398 RepID=A0A6J0I8L7_9PASS|nr:PREDICTED: la-related protein 6 [Lepidothrix coronata]
MAQQEPAELGAAAAGPELAAGSGPVQIRVAVQAAAEEEEDEDEEEERGGGALCPSCSEEDSGRCGRSSGGENDDDSEQNWKPPENDLIQKLIAQIEYYFSDENLEKDAFLLKHVRRNKMGYVSVKLLTSFKKVKHLTRDWRTTAYALKYSGTLELNGDNKKVRRKTPVPLFPSENVPTRMLLVYDIHMISELQALNKQENGCMQERIMEHLLKAFVTFGVISSVRILKPGRDLPPDIRRVSNRYTQLGTQECAIIEFEEVDAAIRAHDSMCTEKRETGMKVVLIGMKPPKKKVPKDKNHDEDSSKSLKKTRSLNKRVEELQFVGDESSANSSSDPESNPTSPLSGRKRTAANTASNLSPIIHPNNHLSPNVSPRSSPWNSPSSLRKVTKKSPLAEDSKLNPSTSPEIPRKCTDYSSDSSITPSGSPWVQRRKAQTLTQEKSSSSSPMLVRKIQNADGLPVGVLRLPKGPDGTKGFHNGCERRKAMKKHVRLEGISGDCPVHLLVSSYKKSLSSLSICEDRDFPACSGDMFPCTTTKVFLYIQVQFLCSSLCPFSRYWVLLRRA